MSAIVSRDARASLIDTIVTQNSDVLAAGGVRAGAPWQSQRTTALRDYSLFDHPDHGRTASDYSRSSSAKRADLCRKALYLLAILCL